MNNAFVRFGRKFAFGVVATGALMASSLMAASNQTRITVNLPHSVTVGSTTLPSGSYTISTLDMFDGEYFVIRSAATQNAVATIQAQKIDAAETDKTEIRFSKDGDQWHFDKMFIEGDGVGYQFVSGK
jgi:hypothetical protein